MAFPIPSFLQFAPPEAAISDLGNLREKALAREQSKEINLVELGLRRQQLNNQAQAQAAEQAARGDELAFRQFALQQNMTTDMAKLAQQQAIADQEAKLAMIQFQGTQNLQRDIANGMKPDEAILKNIPLIAAGNPAALTGFFNTMQRTASQEQIAEGRAETSRENALLRGDLMRELGDVKAQSAKEVATINAKSRLDAALAKASEKIQTLSAEDKIAMKAEVDAISDEFIDLDEKAKRIDAVRMKYKTTIIPESSPAKVRRFNPQTGKIE
jgi:hypothetical protein